jgi:hypothetical protein
MPPNADAVIRDRSHITVRKPDVVTEYDKEVLIRGNWYNVEAFAKKHPGEPSTAWTEDVWLEVCATLSNHGVHMRDVLCSLQPLSDGVARAAQTAH